MKQNLKFLFAAVVAISLVLGCSKLNLSNIFDSSNKLYFCERYILDKDECEGKSTMFTTGYLTVMLDLRPSKKKVNVDKVNINITDLKSGEVIDTFPYDTDRDMDYIYFEKVNFKNEGKFKVSALKPDGTVLATNEIEIKDKN